MMFKSKNIVAERNNDHGAQNCSKRAVLIFRKTMKFTFSITTGLEKKRDLEGTPEFKKMMAADTRFDSRMVGPQLLKDLVRGYNYSFIHWNKNYRKEENFSHSTGLIGDVDEGLPLDEAEVLLKTLNCYVLIITSQNHKKEKIGKGGSIVNCDRFRILIPTVRLFHTLTDLKIALEPINSLLKGALDTKAMLGSQFFIPSPDAAEIREIISDTLYDPDILPRSNVFPSKEHPNHRNIQNSWQVEHIGGLLNADKHQLDKLPDNKSIIYCPFCDDVNSQSASGWLGPKEKDKDTRVIHCSHCDKSYYSELPVLNDEDFVSKIAYSADTIEDDPEPTEWIVSEVLAQSECFSMFGDPGSGKSYAMLQLAITVASQTVKEWLGFDIERHGPVLYILNDGSHRALRNRIRRLCTYLKIPRPSLLYCLNNQGVFQSWEKDVEKFIKIKRPILVIVDSLAMSQDKGDENEASDQKLFSNLLKSWCLDYNLNCSVIHHTTKQSQDQPFNQNHFRGSSHWIGVLSSMMEFRKKAGGVNRYKLVKSRDGSTSAQNERECLYEEFSSISPGTYNLNPEQKISGYHYVGPAHTPQSNGFSSRTRPVPYAKDVFSPGDDKSFHDAAEAIMMKYGVKLTKAQNILNDWVKMEEIEKRRDGKTVFYAYKDIKFPGTKDAIPNNQITTSKI